MTIDRATKRDQKLQLSTEFNRKDPVSLNCVHVLKPEFFPRKSSASEGLPYQKMATLDCVVCFENLTSQDDSNRVPYVGFCGHTVCGSCVPKLKHDGHFTFEGKHTSFSQCPTCNGFTFLRKRERWSKNFELIHALQKLEELQLELNTLTYSLNLQQRRDKHRLLRQAQEWEMNALQHYGCWLIAFGLILLLIMLLSSF